MRLTWESLLSDDVYTRLCECRSIKTDLPELVNAKMLKYKMLNKDFTREDAKIAVLELLDSNGIDIDLTLDEFNNL